MVKKRCGATDAVSSTTTFAASWGAAASLVCLVVAILVLSAMGLFTALAGRLSAGLGADGGR
jgi:hypothetical protein